MILAAALLVLAGLGLFVGGVLTGMTALYWGCVAACVLAAVLLFLARRRIATPAPAGAASAGAAPAKAPATEAAKAPATGSAPREEATGAGRPGGATAASAVEQHATQQRPATEAETTEPPATAQPAPAAELPDPPVEEVEVTDLLLVVDLKDEVLVVDEHPRYHLEGCVHLAGHTPIPLPLDEARTDGFTPCAVCAPDRNLAQRARERKAAGS